ncbi:phosphate ABC transporter ATP-binding protein [Streptomyces sp. NPDC002671]
MSPLLSQLAQQQAKLRPDGGLRPVGWRLVGANNRELGRCARAFESLPVCQAAVIQLRQRLGDVRSVLAMADVTGTWMWRIELDGQDAATAGRPYHRHRECQHNQTRRNIGMVFQKPNPFPAMSIYDNVTSGLKLTGTHLNGEARDDLVEECLTKAGLWQEVRGRLRQPGGALSGGQQQRLCIARSLAVRPKVLLMDEPCSALDPTSALRIEETIRELAQEVTIVIVTHNMQQAARISDQCAFFLAEQGTPGAIVEHGPTSTMFTTPSDPRTADYVEGRFG